MEKKTGIHFYVEVRNLMDIINDEEIKDDDLKRTLHRLNTFFIGFSDLVKKFGGKVEKYTGGRAHVSFEDNMEGENINKEIMEAVASCFIYTNNIFNNLEKYSRYPNFSVNCGIDYGDFYDYTIIESDGSDEYTSVGNVANTSAKIQFYAKKNYIYATGKLVDKLSEITKGKFKIMTSDEKAEFSDKLKEKDIFKAKYTEIFDSKKKKELEENLSEIKEKVKEASISLNLKDITFEGCSHQLNFTNLSLRGINKRLETVAVVCADIRGFTKLFEKDDSNLDDLGEVMKQFYAIMGNCATGSKGTKVQYQGDRVVIVYNQFQGAEDAALRTIKAAFRLNQEIQELDNNWDIKQKLNNNSIGIGIGCGWGKVIATRLGGFNCKDNIILSDAYKYANKAEEQYAGAGQTVISKRLKEYVYEKDESEFDTLKALFSSIDKTGMYRSEATLDEFNQKLDEINKEKVLEEKVMKIALANSKNAPMPWGCVL